jgi:hypothetical protein
MPAVELATVRATLAGQVEGDGPDERGYPGPPGWELGVRLTTSPCKELIGHIERMQDTEIPKKLLYGKLYATRRRGRPK